MKPCTQCGRCCTNPHFMGTMEASASDIARWRKDDRQDILQYADVHDWKPGSAGEAMGFAFADLWMSPRTGNDMLRCPFVRKVRNQDRYTCTIYDTRPEVCREYPTNVSHMQFVNCEMLEDGDTDEDVKRFMIDEK